MLPYSIKKAVLGFFLILVMSALQGQVSNQSEADVLARAEALFAQNNWQEALPLFAQLVSVNSEKPEYNYKFGVCTLLGDHSNHRRPLRYLTNAYKTMGDSPEINFYLGLAYYQNEEFANAMKYFNLYLGKLDANSPERSEILEKVNACLNGMNLDHNKRIAEIIDKNIFQKDNFHRAYRADEFNGMLILKPENFFSDQEKKSGINSYVYISEPRGTLYFSTYENSESTQRDIFKVSLDENGDWGIPEKLPEIINTNFDEAYPVLANNGTSLYFCSKGHSALGGYDIFVSQYDPEKNTFSTPENLGLGINSTFDDVLYIPEKSGDFAWFASDRDNQNEDITVYKVSLINEMMQDNGLMAQASASQEIKSTQGIEETADIHTSSPTNQNQEDVVQAVAPSVKAAQKLNERTLAHQMADTAYLLVSKTKTFLRNLTNKRDRANMISQKKEEQAKNLEVQFQEILASLPNAPNKEQFEQQLTTAIRLKKETYQFRMRADQANRIAWSIGKQIKLKNAELDQSKKDAGNVQTLSVQGNIEGTRESFSLMATNYQVADTLIDYTQNILWISKDKVNFTLPESELAFADNMRQGYDNQTLLADNSANQVIQKEIPVNVIDKRKEAPVLNKAVAIIVIEPMDMVAMKGYNANILPTEDYELEINFTVDAVQALPLVSPIELLARNDQLEMEEESLEIKFQIDAIAPVQLIKPIDFEALAYQSNPVEVDIDVDFNVDAVAAIPVIQPILYASMSKADLPENEDIEINTIMDGVEPYKLIAPIEFETLAYEDIQIDENIEIDQQVDFAQVIPVIETISFDEDLAQNLIPEEEALEINTRSDAIEVIKLIDPISSETIADNLIPEEENLELMLGAEAINIPLINAIQSDELALNTLPEEEEIVISREFYQPIDVAPMISSIAYQEATSTVPMDDELEINADQVTAMAIEQIQPIEPTYIELAMNMEETLEISDRIDQPEARTLIQPIFAQEMAVIVEMNDEPLEITIETEENIQPAVYDLIHPVSYTELTMNTDELQESLEITNTVGFVNIIPAIHRIEFPAYAISNLVMNDDLEISFKVDEHSDLDILTADNSALTQQDMREVSNDIPQLNSEYYYLHQTMGVADEIETSQSDFNLLRSALVNPDELSYEELLYAASITPKPEDKLTIYNFSFVHIDRDWRAFNNAAIIALNIKDVEKAECFLYQASLISSDNGNILNNMGILDCYKSDFTSAENHFMAASERGINTDYNLRIVKSIEEPSNNPEKLESKIGKSRIFDIIGNNGGYNSDR